MNAFADLLTQHARLSILKILSGSPEYSANESILQQALGHFGINVSRDKVRTELGWLEEQSLLTIEDMKGFKVATATKRGADVAAGRATVPGVKRPSPEG